MHQMIQLSSVDYSNTLLPLARPPWSDEGFAYFSCWQTNHFYRKLGKIDV